MIRRASPAWSPRPSYDGLPPVSRIPREMGRFKAIGRDGIREARWVALLQGGGDSPGMNAAMIAVRRHLGGELPLYGVVNGWNGTIIPGGRFVNIDGSFPDDLAFKGGAVLSTGVRGRSPIDPPIPGTSGDPMEAALANLEGCAALVIAGGDGSGKVGLALSQRGIPVIHIPCTVDGGFPNSHTIGFETSREVGGELVKNLVTTADSCGAVVVFECFGGNTGELILELALTGGAAFALIPEETVALKDVVCPRIEAELDLGRGAVIGIGEAAGFIKGDGTVVERSMAKGAALAKRQIGHELADALTAIMPGIHTRVDTVGRVLRGASPNAADRAMAAEAGRIAAEAILGGGQLGFTLAFNHLHRPPKPQSLAQVFGDINQVRTRTGYTSRIITRWRSEFGID